MGAVEIRESFRGLAARVVEAGDCLSVPMGELRDLIRAGRLDAGPIAQIEHNLRENGLGHTQLGRSQNDWALIYTAHSPIARVIEAAQGRGENSGDDLREAVRELAAADEALRSDETEELESLRATVDQIKALVTAA